MPPPENADAPTGQGRGVEDNMDLGKSQGKHNTGIVARWHLLGLACRDPRMSRANCAVLHNILSRTNSAGEAWPSVRKISDDTGLDRRTVTRAVKSLVELGYLDRQSGNRKDPNVYRMGRGEPAPTVVGANSPLGESVQVGANSPRTYGRTRPKRRGEPAHVTCPLNSSSELEQEQGAKRTAIPTEHASRDADASPVWTHALAWLTKSGMQESTARSLIGKARKTLTDEQLINLVREGQQQQVADPKSWLAAGMRRPGRRSAKPAGAITRDTRTDAQIEAANLAELARFGMLPEQVTP